MPRYKLIKRTSLTGGTDTSLDGIRGVNVDEGDLGLTHTSGGDLYFHCLDADSGQAESSPDYIMPDDAAGAKRWKNFVVHGGIIEAAGTMYDGWDNALATVLDGLVKTISNP